MKMDYVISGVPTGYFEIDYHTKGFQRGDLIIFSGMPQSYKTSLLLNIASNTAIEHGNTVYYFSLDSSVESLMSRSLFQVSNTNINSYYFNVLDYGDINLLYKAGELIKKSPFHIFHDRKYTLEKIEIECMKLKNDLKLIIIDYLQMLKDYNNNEASVEKIICFLKELAIKINIPVVLIHQDLDGAKDRYRSNEFTVDSHYFTKNGADVVFYINSEVWVAINEEENTRETSIEVILAKQKNGPSGTFKVLFEMNSKRFYNSKEELIDILQTNSRNKLCC